MKRLLHIGLCTPNEFKDIIECQSDVISKLERPDFYYPSMPDELKLLFENTPHTGFIIGAYHSEHLIGFASVAHWLGPYYGYSYKSDDICYSIEDTVVRKAYYGCGIQLKLWNYIIDLLPQTAVLLCTIHPENIICLQNAISLGFTPKTTAYPFGDSPRLIMERKGKLGTGS